MEEIVKWIARKKWWNKLNPVFSFYGISGLIVCMTNSDGYHFFTSFSSYGDFFLYQEKFDPNYRCFFEVIIGDSPQKPHFDIDVSSDNFPLDNPTDENIKIFGERIKDEVILASIEILTKLNVPISPSDFLIYSSHGFMKTSFHIIISNLCHTDNKEAEEFYRQVMIVIKEKYPNTSDLKKIIDFSVYKNNQQFRILGSQKINSGRPKKVNKKFNYFGQEINHSTKEKSDNERYQNYLDFEESLVGNISGCAFIPQLLEFNHKNKVYEDQNDISLETAQDAITLLFEKISETNFSYKIGEIKGEIITLRRVKSSLCPLCERIHEHENPYLIVHDGMVNFYCRRAEYGKRLFLGIINFHPKNYIIPEEIECNTGGEFQFGSVIIIPDDVPESQFCENLSFTELAKLVPPLSPKKKGDETIIPDGFLSKILSEN